MAERMTCLYATPPSSLTISTAVPFVYHMLAVLQDDMSVFGTRRDIQFHSPVVKTEIESHTILSDTATAYQGTQARENDKQSVYNRLFHGATTVFCSCAQI